MIRTMCSYAFALLLGVCLSALLTLPTRAEADLVFNASACFANLSYNDDITRASNGGVQNLRLTGTNTVSCVAARQTQATNPSISGWVSVWDFSSTGNISCTLYTVDRANGAYNYNTQTSSGSSGQQTLTWSSVTSATNYYYHVACTLPLYSGSGSASGVVSYFIDEA